MIYNIYANNKNNDYNLNGSYDSENGHTIIYAGSVYKKEEAKSLLIHNVRFRKKVLDECGSENCTLTKDYEFNSAIAAASVLIGNQASGLTIFRIVGSELTLKEALYPDGKKTKKKEPDEDTIVNVNESPESKDKTIYLDPSKKVTRLYSVKQNALKNSGYTCFVDASHETFLTDSGTAYMEAHHLIPFKYHERYFPKSIQVEANVVCLCPKCHRELHYGKNRKEILKLLYDERRDFLLEYGLDVSFEELLEFYDLKRKK